MSEVYWQGPAHTEEQTAMPSALTPVLTFFRISSLFQAFCLQIRKVIRWHAQRAHAKHPRWEIANSDSGETARHSGEHAAIYYTRSSMHGHSLFDVASLLLYYAAQVLTAASRFSHAPILRLHHGGDALRITYSTRRPPAGFPRLTNAFCTVAPAIEQLGCLWMQLPKAS